MPFDFDFLEHISCQLVCFDDFPDSIGDPEDAEGQGSNQKRKPKNKKGRG